MYVLTLWYIWYLHICTYLMVHKVNICVCFLYSTYVTYIFVPTLWYTWYLLYGTYFMVHTVPTLWYIQYLIYGTYIHVPTFWDILYKFKVRAVAKSTRLKAEEHDSKFWTDHSTDRAKPNLRRLRLEHVLNDSEDEVGGVSFPPKSSNHGRTSWMSAW